MLPQAGELAPAGNVPGSSQAPQSGLVALTSSFGTSQLTAITAFMAAVGAACAGFGTLARTLGGKAQCAGVLVGLLALLFFFHTLPVLLERRKRLRLASIAGATRAGYFQLSVREDEESFTRADGKHEEILKWLRSAPSRLLYLTGSSGAGKSSLLEAWVLPKLEREGVKVIRLRGYQDPARVLEDELKRKGAVWKENVPETTDLTALFEQAVAILHPARILLVFDQFEEFLILQEESQQKRFVEFLQAQGKVRAGDSGVLLVFRAEYDGFIGELNLPAPAYGQNFQKVSAFTERAGQEFLTGSGLKIQDQMLADVLREASRVEDTPGMIRPVTLNLCGLVLARFSAGLPFSFRPGHMIRGFVHEAIFDRDLREDAPLLLRKLISDERTKKPRTIDELAQGTKLDPLQARGVMFKLSEPDRAIVHAVDAESRTWEISHDFLVPIIDSLLASWRRPLWSVVRPWLPLGYAAVLLALLFVAPRLFPSPLDELDKLHWQTTTLDAKQPDDQPLLQQGVRYVLTFNGAASPDVIRASFRPMRRMPARFTVRFSPGSLASFDEATFKGWRDLNELAGLYIGSNRLADISGLKDLPHSVTALGLGDITGRGGVKSADIQALPRNLTWLNIYYNGSISSDGIQALPSSLEWLDLSGDNITGDELSLLPKHLIRLALNDNPGIREKGLESLPPSIRELFLSGDPGITEAGVKGLPAWLNFLDLSNSGVTDAELSVLPPHLTTLRLNDDPGITDKGLESLPPSIRELFLSGDSGITEAGLKALPATLEWLDISKDGIRGSELKSLPPRLIRLGLNNDPDITDEDLANLPPSLKELHVAGDPKITDAGLKKLPASIKVYR